MRSVIGDFGGGERTEVSPPKDGGSAEKIDRLADALKRLAGKVTEVLPTVVGSIVGAILSFLRKAIGFVAEHTWALIVFVAGLVRLCLMQKNKKS